MGNAWCEQLGIAVPDLEVARSSREASTYSLLLVALLEHGEPMTLPQVAARFVEAGVFDTAGSALASLSRCRPGRAPVHRDGDLYALDPHDDELDMWVFRLGLRPARVAPKPRAPRPPDDQPLSIAEVDEAFRDRGLLAWPAQRIALAVLEAHGRAMPGDEVVAFVAARTTWHKLKTTPTPFKLKGAAVAVDVDGRWSIVPGAAELGRARRAVRDAVEVARRYARSDPAELAARQRDSDRARATRAADLAALRRVIVHAAPASVALVDVGERSLAIVSGGELPGLAARLEQYDMICGVDIRTTLRALGVDPGKRRLGEMGPAQKTVTWTGGRIVKITTQMLIEGSCGIRASRKRPEKTVVEDAKALLAFYEYGMLHGQVRLRLRGYQQMFPAPWQYRDEPTLYAMKQEAVEHDVGIVAVVGHAPPWDDPWEGAVRLEVVPIGPYDVVLVDDYGRVIEDTDLQRARLEVVLH